MKKISVVIPALNEEDGIGHVVSAIPKLELEELGYDVEILVVDNGSHDSTAELASKAGANVVTEKLPGYGRALKKGFSSATGHIIVTADADRTYPIEDIPRLVQFLEEAHLDFITTNRFAGIERGAMSRRNWIGNKVLTWVTNVLYGIDLKDSQSGMWVFSSNILDQLLLKSDGMPLSEELKIEVCYFNRFHWRELPIRYKTRTGKVKLRALRDGLQNLLFLFRKRISR